MEEGWWWSVVERDTNHVGAVAVGAHLAPHYSVAAWALRCKFDLRSKTLLIGRVAKNLDPHLAVRRTAFAAYAPEGTRPSSMQLWGKSPEMQNVSRARIGKQPPPSTAAGRGTAGRTCPFAGLASKAILQRVGPAGTAARRYECCGTLRTVLARYCCS